MNNPLTGLFKDYRPLPRRYDEMDIEKTFPFALIPRLLNEILENTDEACETLATDFFDPQRNIDAIEETMGGGQQ
jgi:hypothetical protein